MISGKSFADRCQWVIDPRYPDRRPFSYPAARHGDWVFVNCDHVHELSRKVPYIAFKKFNFIVHNSDSSFGLKQLKILLPMALHIYAINTSVYHPKLTTIPIGFVDRHLPFLASFRRPEVPRDIEIYSNFKVSTNPGARNACLRAFPDIKPSEPRHVPDYYADLCRSKFVLCPEGTGIDTHRVYEALLCGATPVVLRNSLSHLYQCLPVCIINDWKDPFYVPEGKTFSTNIQDYLK